MQAILPWLTMPFSILMIAWKSVLHRRFAALLTMLSMGLGVMLIVSVLTMFGVISQSFRNNSSLGYDMVVGAKGGKMQLTLNSVYYLSTPIETIPYEYYLEFFDGEFREEELQNSIASRVDDSRRNAAELDAILLGGGMIAGPASLFQTSLLSAVEDERREALRMEADGRFANYASVAIPICLGDYFHEYRAVATNTDFFDELIIGYESEWDEESGEYMDVEQYMQCSDGRFFEYENEKNGFFECVVGCTVAEHYDVKVGDLVNPEHGAPGGDPHRGFTVVGILDRTGTPNDRAVFINIEGFFLMEDHSMTLDLADVDPDEESDEEEDETSTEESSGEDVAEEKEATGEKLDKYPTNVEPLPMEQRQVTAILVRSADELGLGSRMMIRPIDKGVLRSSLNWSPYQPAKNIKQDAAQAVSPVAEINSLFEMFVNPVQYALLFLTGMICLVSGISILVSIYNSMSERRHEIAVMRALGASRMIVMAIILFEAIILAVIGGIGGWIGGHALNALLSPYIEPKTGVSISFFDFAPPLPFVQMPKALESISPEMFLIPSLIVLAVIVGLYPAVAAYRTDVSKSL